MFRNLEVFPIILIIVFKLSILVWNNAIVLSDEQVETDELMLT